MAGLQTILSCYVDVRGIRTHYVVAGEGNPVVLVHGAGPGASGLGGWRGNIPALATRFRVIALDTLGFGHTDKPTNIAYSDQASVEHLAGFIDALCLDRVKLCGSSRGAYIAAKYMLDHPNRVDRLLMVSSASIANAMGLEWDRSKMRGLETLRGYDGTREKMRAFLEVILADRSKITDELVESRVALASLPGHDYVIKAQAAYRNALRTDPNQRQLFDIRIRLPMVTIPMCMVWGGRDSFAPVEFADGLRELLPNVELVVFPDAGHQAQTDERDRFNELALRFFSG